MYLDNPSGSYCIFVAERDGEIVGVGHDLYIDVKHGEEDFRTVYGTDVAVHPEHRRRGLYTKLVRARLKIKMKNSDFQYGYTTNPILLERRKRSYEEEPSAYYFPYKACKYIWIKDVDLHLKMMKTNKAWLMKQGHKIKKFMSKIRHMVDRSIEDDGSYSINVAERFDDSSDSFWRKVAPHYNFIGKRDKEYLNWRYCDPRSGNYTVLQAKDKDKLLGYVVTSMELGDLYPTGYIIDLLALHGKNEVAVALVNAAVKKINENGVNVIRALIVKGHPYESVFERNGFIDNRESLYVRYRKSADSEESKTLRDSPPEKIHLVYSDLFVR